uniref:EGF-like domain-containing protein n=1 Tax=Anopheles christyi TaxID=43041 RepID=A0A182JQ20_9DIPT
MQGINCSVHSDCGDKLQCLVGLCVDPCRSGCGERALCTVKAHLPICSCPFGHTGNPSERCLPLDGIKTNTSVTLMPEGMTEYPEEYYDGHKIDRSDEFTTVEPVDTTTTFIEEQITLGTLEQEEYLISMNQTGDLNNIHSTTAKDGSFDKENTTVPDLISTVVPNTQTDDTRTTLEPFTTMVTAEADDFISETTIEEIKYTSNVPMKKTNATVKPNNHSDTLTKQDRKSTDLEETDQLPTVTTPIDDYFVELSSTSKHYEFMQNSEATVTPLAKKTSTTSMTTTNTTTDINTTTEPYLLDDRSLPLSTSGYDGEDYIDEDSTTTASTIETTLSAKTTYEPYPSGTTAEPIIEIIQCRYENDCNTNETCAGNICIDPCAQFNPCPQDVPCQTLNHVPMCLCNSDTNTGYSVDCMKTSELGCRHSNECPLERSCINGICVDPCRSGNPCDVGEECEVQNHETVCVK